MGELIKEIAALEARIEGYTARRDAYAVKGVASLVASHNAAIAIMTADKLALEVALYEEYDYTV